MNTTLVEGYAQISAPYLLALDVPVYEVGSAVFADSSWAKDLFRHLDYIDDLTLLCPGIARDSAQGLVRVEHPRLRVVTYPAAPGTRAALAALPRMAGLFWTEVGRARIVHTSLAGWPIPSGFLAIPMGRLRRRTTVVIVESAFWRLTRAEAASWKRRAVSRLREWLSRACVARADFVAYTQREYQKSLPARRAGGGVIAQASWVDEADLLSQPEGVWSRKPARPLRLLFAGRLIAEKGVNVLIEAMARARDAEATCDFIGNGPEVAAVLAAARTDPRLRMLEPVPYGAPFLELLRGYHAVVVPSLSDEQPRIVYDAYSQAVPVLSSDTGGLVECVEDGVTGRVVRADDPEALAAAIRELARDPAALAPWGKAALHRAGETTHLKMHMQRSHQLAALLA